MTDAPIIIPLGGDNAVVIEQDRMLFTVLRNGVRVATDKLGMALVAVRVVEPGMLTEQVRFEPPEHARTHKMKFTVGPGPAVWIRTMNDLIIPTPNAQQLAAEIERRRLRVARHGGLAAQAVWERAPSLRVAGPDGYRPGRGQGTPDYPADLTGTAWQPMPALPTPEPMPGWPPQDPVVPQGLPYPEQLHDQDVPLGGSLRLVVGLRRLTLSHGPVPAGSIVAEPNPSPSTITVPLAAWHVIKAGTLRDAPGPIRWYAPDGLTEIQLPLTNGPTLWLWGPTAEWLISTPNAEALAHDIQQRRAVSMRFPISSNLGPERKTWHDFPDTAPVDLPHGRALPPIPAWAPPTPTAVPPDCWT